MKIRKLTHLQFIALGFAVMILIGTVLLSLPFSSQSGEPTSVLTSMFTVVSASCVTGLVLVDTATHWSLFGQIVIITLIQIGGLGFMTIATLLFSFVRKNLGLRSRAIMAESINTSHIAGLKKLTRKIIIGTLIFEGSGAVLLSIRFIPQFGFVKGIYYSVFHAISAFCNAGFDLMGIKEPFCSLVDYSDDLLINITLMLLITIGGIGFLVWDDIYTNKHHFKRYHLHTKIVLSVSFILTFGGALLFWLFEKDLSLSGLSVKEQILASLFSSVTVRTAGFNTVDLSGLSDATVLFLSGLMFIGGSSGSTAGGIKTTTIAVIVIFLFYGLRSKRRPQLFGRALEENSVRKASSVMFFNFILAFSALIAICALQDFELRDVVFETFSAMGTVGMSTGITRDLSTVSKCIIMFLMYCGRVGSTSFALALLEKKVDPPVLCPVENITIG